MPRYKVVNTLFLILILFLILLDWFQAVDWKVYAGIFLIFIILQVYGALYMSSGFFLPAICSGKGNSKNIAITFDDGPGAGTEKVLSILKDYQVQACFFCIGKNSETHQHLLKEIHRHGHIIGNHSFQHGWNFDLLSSKKMKAELTKTDDFIESTLGIRPNFFRPPYGVTNPNLAAAVRNDYKTIGWSVRSFDTVIKDPAKLMGRITRNLKGGDIILFHDHSESTQQILPDFIKHVQSIGLKIVRLDELIGESPYTTT